MCRARPLDRIRREGTLLTGGAGVALWSAGMALLVVATTVVTLSRIACW